MRKILYIEDSPVSTFMLRRMMRTMDYELIEAGDGSTGILSAMVDMPDIILLDLNLPDMTGYEAITRIREHTTLRHIPIIVLTSETSEAARHKCVQLGCEGYLQKPVSKSMLLRILSQFRLTA